MLELVAYGAVAVAWLLCLFTVLQLSAPGSRRALVAMSLVLIAGIAVVAARNRTIGVGWMQNAELRSDAIALGVLPATIATCIGVLVAGSTARSWATPTALLSCLACAIASFAALAIGRSGWYWEFVAAIVAGLLMAAVGSTAALRRDSSANERLVYGAAATFGVFLAIGGTALLVAWRATA